MNDKSCVTCEHYVPKPSGLLPGTCRRYPPVFVTNTGLSEDRARYPTPPDTLGCGEHESRPANGDQR